MSNQIQFCKNIEGVHRRTYSNNIDSIKGLQAGHRRTMSNNAHDFAGLTMLSLPSTKAEATHPEPFKISFQAPQRQKKKKGFVSLVNAAISYFNQEAQFPITFPPSEIDILKTQLDKLQNNYVKIEKGNTRLSDDCEKLRKKLKEEQQAKGNLEININELKRHMNLLEGSLKKINAEIQKELKQNEDMQHFAMEQEKIRYSPLNHVNEDSEKKLKKKNSDADRPMPRPINYKPITQRGIRNSKDILRK